MPPAHGPVTCREFLAELWSLVDGECAPARAELLHEHLAGCDRCRSAYRTGRWLTDRLGRACSDVRAPAGLRAQVRRRLRTG
jgi:mycothiol system anti-sigma-R factor